MRTSRLAWLAQLLALVLCTAQVQSQSPFALDAAFRAGINSIYVTSVAPFPDGSVLLSGQIQFPDDEFPRGSAKVLPDGSQDLGFPPFPQTIGGGNITPWQEGYYIGVGQTVRRLFASGYVDPSFILMNSGPYFSSVQGGDYHVFPDGRVLMSGAHVLSDTQRGFEGLYSLIWFSNEGYLDTTRIHRYCDEVIFEIEAQPSGKFLCSGTMNAYEGQPVKRIFRVLSDGALDNSFDADIQQWGEAFVFETLPDQRVLAGGVFKRPGSTDTLGLLRFLPDGNLDATFHMPLLKANFIPYPALAYVLDVLVMPNGNLVITGRFDEVDGQVRGGIAMLDMDGNLLDEAFTGQGCGRYNYNGTLYKGISGITPGPDGSYYIHGAYHGYDDGITNDTTQRMVSRLYGLDVGVLESGQKPFVRLWPNPANSNLNVELSELVQPPVQLELNDLLGRVILSQWCWSSICTWNVECIAPGPYTSSRSATAQPN